MNLTCEEEINCDKTIRFHLLSLWEGGGGGRTKLWDIRSIFIEFDERKFSNFQTFEEN